MSNAFLIVSSPRNKYFILTNPKQTPVCILGVRFFGGVVFTSESEPVVGGERAEGAVEGAVLEAPRPPNSLLSINAAARPLGTRFPPTLGGVERGFRGTGGGEKEHNQTDAESCRSMCICVCTCVCAILYFCTPVDSHICVCPLYVFRYRV